VKRRKT